MPHWGCACGTSNNWASRIVCRGCGKQAPRRIINNAAAAAAKASAAPRHEASRKPRGAWAKGPPVHKGSDDDD
eukprot:1146186-Karenia_brevis.AAC.1